MPEMFDDLSICREIGVALSSQRLPTG
jgi:hypothetical protein